MSDSNHIDFFLGSATSFEMFFKKHYHLACLVAMKYIKDNHQAEDIVQETFMNLWQKREELKIQTSLKHYLLNAVRNKSINFLQREQKLDELKQLSLSEDPEDDFSEEDLSVRIAQSIESLPPQCKKIFLLAYRENLTYAEIAQTLDISKNTVKTQMGIAYKILREKIRNYFTTLILLPVRRLILKID